MGIVDTHDALVKARELGLDLVEVSPTSRPPVCRIMDYGKFKYAQKKKERKARASRHETELKEVRVRTPKISKHDLEIKINHARAFLMRGDRVQFTLRFRGARDGACEPGPGDHDSHQGRDWPAWARWNATSRWKESGRPW